MFTGHLHKTSLHKQHPDSHTGAGASRHTLTQALRLKQAGVAHPHRPAPGQEVGCVVPGEEGARRRVPLEGHLLRGEQLPWQREHKRVVRSDPRPIEGNETPEEGLDEGRTAVIRELTALIIILRMNGVNDIIILMGIEVLGME